MLDIIAKIAKMPMSTGEPGDSSNGNVFIGILT